MAGRKRKVVDTNDNVNNGGARLKIKPTSKSPTRERSTPSSFSDDTQNSQRLTANLPRFVAPEYEVNTQVLCQYSDSYYYDAKIVKVRKLDNGECLYTIHYNGWNSRYDEEITHANACEKFLVYTPENLAIAKRELTEARKRKKSKSQKKPDKKAKKDDQEEKKSISSQPVAKRARTHSSNTRQGSSVEGGAEGTNDEAETGDDSAPVPYLAQVPEKNKTTLIFPCNIDKALSDDCDLVSRQLKVPKTPARYTIDDILTDYLQASYDPANPDDTKLRQNIDDIIVFFNKMVNMRILYKLEFVQHLDLLNAKRREFDLPALSLDDFMDDLEVPDSPASEEAKEDEDSAFLPPKQIKPDPSTEGVSDKRQTRNKKSTVEQLPSPLKAVLVPKPKKKENPVKSSFDIVDRNNSFNFADSYGFIHLVRFFYHYNALIKNKVIANAIYTNYIELINGIIEFLSLNAKKYYSVEQDYEIQTPAYQRQAFSH